jgi:hypothetical protein
MLVDNLVKDNYVVEDRRTTEKNRIYIKRMKVGEKNGNSEN